MSAWRVVFTDSEDLTGVAPVCPRATEPGGLHDIHRDGLAIDRFDANGVYDCCPGLHIECYSKSAARIVAEIFTANDAEVCS